uniref:Superoxide dismutase n=1 Tax=Eutreptiella gymnastica TaxID=73025 RepID=A0A7S1NCZ0_9EUGL|mmetsp:Transcript_152543/g.266334  ORF Transcript_152543/g.266334 Transcript_152543/m.266334 type:complete len:258 (+) Transcript_152543:46-819(+)
MMRLVLCMGLVCFASLVRVSAEYASLPALPYGYHELEPYIDEATMRIHHQGHHQAYTMKLNGAVAQVRTVAPDLIKDDPQALLAGIADVVRYGHEHGIEGAVLRALRNNLGGYVNHVFFWQCLAPKAGTAPEPSGALLAKIQATWGSIEAFKSAFSETAAALFGSGWAWLVINRKTGDLSIVSTKDQESPLAMSLDPLLGIDLWEHAYYLKYQNKRPQYIQAFFHIINWEFVQRNYQQALSSLVQSSTTADSDVHEL